MAVYRDVQPGDTLRIGDTIIEIAHKSGQRARLRIESKLDVEHIKAGSADAEAPRPAMKHPNLPPAPPAPAAQPEPAKRPRLTMPSMPLPA